MKLIFAFILFLNSVHAFAYIPPADFIVDQAIKNRSDMRTIELMVKVTDLATRGEFKENLYLDFNSGKGYYQALSQKDDHLGSDDFEFTGLHDLGNFWLILGMDSSPFRTREALNALMVPAESKVQVALGRSGDKATWYWGTPARIDYQKDEFVPIRFEDRNDRYLFTVKETLQIGSSWVVPKTLEISIDHKPAYRAELRSIKVNPKKRSIEGPAQTVTNEIVKRWLTLVH